MKQRTHGQLFAKGNSVTKPQMNDLAACSVAVILEIYFYCFGLQRTEVEQFFLDSLEYVKNEIVRNR